MGKPIIQLGTVVSCESKIPNTGTEIAELPIVKEALHPKKIRTYLLIELLALARRRYSSSPLRHGAAPRVHEALAQLVHAEHATCFHHETPHCYVNRTSETARSAGTQVLCGNR